MSDEKTKAFNNLRSKVGDAEADRLFQIELENGKCLEETQGIERDEDDAKAEITEKLRTAFKQFVGQGSNSVGVLLVRINVKNV